MVGDRMAHVIEFIQKRTGRFIYDNGNIGFPHKRAETADQSPKDMHIPRELTLPDPAPPAAACHDTRRGARQGTD